MDSCQSRSVHEILKMSQQISKQKFNKNINEHLILGGKALLEVVTDIILPKLIRNELCHAVKA